MTEVTDDEIIRVELERVARRWQQLPLDHALRAAPAVLALTRQLADTVRVARGSQPVPVPDLGPAVVVDQLRVLVYDARRTGVLPAADLAARLQELRRTL